MFKENLPAVLISIALIACALLIRSMPSGGGAFQSLVSEGVFYRLNQKTGRVDVLVPTSEGALMMPVGQISSPMSEKMNDDQKKQFSNFLKTVAQYLDIQRSKSLGLKMAQPGTPATEKNKE